MTVISSFLEKIPNSLMDKSGTVFNSGRQTFELPSALYILGANPGGSPTSYTRYNNTVQGNVEDALHHWGKEYSPFRDQRWGRYGPGRHPMQRGMLHLFSRVNRKPEKVPASEVVFLRSKDLTELGDFISYAELCWPFHQAVIDTLDVRVIVCLGQKAGGFMRRKLGANEKVGEFRERISRGSKRGPRSQAHTNEDGIAVVELAHPSRSEWRNEKCDPTHLAVNALAGK